MKKIALLLVIGCIGFTLNAQDKVVAKKADPNAAIFEFEKETIDYGTIEKGADGKRVFKFKNVGKSPLIISNVKTSCGCTVPTVPKEPILPGQTAEMVVKYDTNRVMPFNKAITIYSNASQPKKVVYIKGVVKKVSALTLLERKEKSMVENN
ncbi:MAG: DUF1573 domain-containing protein [Flavobacteriaceae bacterium]|nr:DUF1573 domain-containing protein [Flavobacteriaceae bacterium]